MSNIITDFDFSPGNVFNANERFVIRPKQSPRVDEMVSKIVGRNILTTDPKLIKLVAKWKMENKKLETDDTPDNFLKNEDKIRELKEVFA